MSNRETYDNRKAPLNNGDPDLSPEALAKFVERRRKDELRKLKQIVKRKTKVRT